MARRIGWVLFLGTWLCVVGCDGNGGPPAATPTVTATGTVTGTPTNSPTPTVTPIPPRITHLGVARGDDVPEAPTDVDPEGRLIYVRPQGQGMWIIVEAERGTLPIAVEAYDQAGGLPGLQVLVSNPLGDGDPAVCDFDRFDPDSAHGVPGTNPPAFSDAPAVVAAINDLGCRVDDGAGAPFARTKSADACTRSDTAPFGFGFVDPFSDVQFCLSVASKWAFPDGDTIVAARVRDVAGTVSTPREIVIRVGLPAATTE